MIAKDTMRQAVHRLKQSGVPDPARDVRMLLAEAMGVGTDRLTLHLQDDVSAEQLKGFLASIDQRADRRPVSQILGRRQFYGRDFKVTSDVLDPRPETETLISEALRVPFKSILDLGTGSGCILLTLLAERQSAQGTGVDISSDALEIAGQNAENIGVVDRVEFKTSDWFSAVEGQYDLIVSNPPYIDEAEWESLDPEPRKWEPKHALTPGADGLEPYRIIASNARQYLVSNGRLMVEIGWKQGAQVAQIFQDAGLKDIRIVRDLDGRDRVVTAKFDT